MRPRLPRRLVRSGKTWTRRSPPRFRAMVGEASEGRVPQITMGSHPGWPPTLDDARREALGWGLADAIAPPHARRRLRRPAPQPDLCTWSRSTRPAPTTPRCASHTSTAIPTHSGPWSRIALEVCVPRGGRQVCLGHVEAWITQASRDYGGASASPARHSATVTTPP